MNIEQVTDQKLGDLIRQRIYEVLKDLYDGRLDFVGCPTVGSGYDLSIRGRLENKNEFDIFVDCKRNPRPSLFQNLAHRHKKLDDPFDPENRPFAKILGAPYVSDRLASVCRQHKWGWIDLAGNCRIDVPGVWVVERKGCPSVYTRSEPRVNLGTAEAGRVLHALLHLDHVNKSWTQRSLKDACVPKVSLGLVNKIVNHLKEEAYLEGKSKNGFKVTAPEGLLTAWRKAYRFDRTLRLSYFTLKKGNALHQTLNTVRRGEGQIIYASFSAADRQAAHVRQPKSWLYVSEYVIPQVEEALEATEVESGENLVMLIPNDEGVFYKPDIDETGMRIPATSPIQTYLDLFSCGGRGEEAADAILSQVIRPIWRKDMFKNE